MPFSLLGFIFEANYCVIKAIKATVNVRDIEISPELKINFIKEVG